MSGFNEVIDYSGGGAGKPAIRTVGTTTATITGDVNVDASTGDSFGLVGKVSGGDFTTIYTSVNQITCGTLPTYHPNLISGDITSIVQINNAGSVVATYTRDDAAITVSTNVIAVSGANFSAADTFVVYTNIARYPSVQGTVANNAPDGDNPVKVGFKAYDPASMPSDVSANSRVNASSDLKGRQYVYLGTTLDSTNDSISTIFSTHSNINTSAQAASLVIKGSAGRLIAIRGYNAKASTQFIQIHDAAALPADANVPEESFAVAGSSNFEITFPEEKSFTTGIVVCNSSTQATKTIGSADCWFSADYR